MSKHQHGPGFGQARSLYSFAPLPKRTTISNRLKLEREAREKKYTDRYEIAQAYAIMKRLPFLITKEEFTKIEESKTCCICGTTNKYEQIIPRTKNYEKGYTAENMWLECFRCFDKRVEFKKRFKK